jgi:SRSO17 transposase
VATWNSSLPSAYRLYLPKEWAEDAERRKKTEVPEEVEFQTKPEIALDQIRAAVAATVDRGVVLADAAYGINTEFRDGLMELGLRPAICCGRAKLDDSLGAGQTAATSKTPRKNGTTSAAIAKEHGPSARLGQTVGVKAALHCLQGNRLA